MKRTHFITTQNNEKLSDKRVLVIDKNSPLSLHIIRKIPIDARVVLVGNQIPESNPAQTFRIPYQKQFPQIPEISYAFIFVIVNNQSEFSDVIPSLLKKAKQENTKLVIVVSYLLFSNKELNQIKKENIHAQIVMYGDIFSVDSLWKQNNRINKLIKEAAVLNSVTVQNNGITKSYPVFIDDVTSGILEVAFGIYSKDTLFFLYPREGITELSIARYIKKNNPEVQLRFRKTKITTKTDLPTLSEKGIYLLDTTSHLRDRITKINTEKLKDISKGEESIPLPNPRGFLSAVRYSTLLFIFILLLPIFSTIVFAVLGMWQLDKSKNFFLSGNLPAAEKTAQTAHGFFTVAKKSSESVVLEARIIGQENKILVYKTYLELAADASEVMSNAISAVSDLREMVMGKRTYSKEEFVKVTNNLKAGISQYQKQRLELSSENIPFAFFKDKLKQYEQVLLLLGNVSDVLPKVLGFEGEQMYAILFQNNMELRPGGGFIGSYAVVTVNQGKIKHFEIRDVYDTDGQLKGHIEPPFAIRRYMGIVHWFLRDSNFNPDFSKNAKIAAQILKEETGEEVDGVIGIDVTFVKNLVGAFGSIYVADYNETVTENNFYTVTQSHVEKNFFPGSTQKKDFLRTLLNSIQLSLESKKSVSYPLLVQAITESLLQKHILFAFSDVAVQNVFAASKLSSTVADERAVSRDQINDFLGIIDANLGVNKTNYYIERNIHQSVAVTDTSLSEVITIQYKNTSPLSPLEGGDYKNYLRVVVPSGALLKKIVVDGVVQKTTAAVTDPLIYEKKNFVPPAELEVETVTENGKVMYGFLVQVPKQMTKTIEVYINLPFKIPSPVFTYNLRVFKQPGSSDGVYSLSVVYPQNLKLLKTTGENSENSIIKSTSGKTEFVQKQFVTDTDISFSFTE